MTKDQNDREMSLKTQGFAHTWENDPGLKGFLSAVNNQPLGLRFMITAFSFFLIAGVLALLMRIQLTQPEQNFFGPQTFNQLFTMHGSIMMFLFVVPFLEGVAMYILPMMIGSRDMAFPRLSSFSYWTYLFGGSLFLLSLFLGQAPDAGWFAYTPLSGPKYSGIGIDFWVLGLGLVEVSGVATGVEIIVTILKFRSPGMNLTKMPLFVWSMLITGMMIIFAFTVLLMATFMLEMDRMVGMNFFNVEKGGSSLLWQHLFWFFGHPEVYIMFLPAAGIVSTIVSTFARRPIVGYPLVVTAMILMGFLSFGLWVHHMFTTGLPHLANAFFTGASLVIVISSGIQIFAWIATLWGRRPEFKTPFLYILGFFAIFTLGGLTGVMVAVAPFDLQVHDTYFIVAHFHYVLIGGVVFPMFAAIVYWFPKFTGRMMNEPLGKWTFCLLFLGFNLTFFPMHIMGILGLPRRVYTYPAQLGLDGLNVLATLGAFAMALAVLIFIVNALVSLRKGEKSGDNPWQSDTLEWTISSPPPIYGFFSPPIFDGNGQDSQLSKILTAAPIGWRATHITSAVSAQEQGVQWLSRSTLLPFLCALILLVFFTSMLLKLYLLAFGSLIFFFGFLIQWLWPSADPTYSEDILMMEKESGLTLHPSGTQSVVWWGTIGLLIILTMALGSLVFSYFYLWLYSEQWPQDSLPVPEPWIHLGALVVLFPVVHMMKKVKDKMTSDERKGAVPCLVLSLILGVTSLTLLTYQTLSLSFLPSINAYASAVHSLYWFNILLLIPALGLLLAFLVRLLGSKEIILHSLRLQSEVVLLYLLGLFFLTGLVFATVCLSPLLF